MHASPDPSISVIAVIGAGFAGSLLAVQLAAQARSPLRVLLYDAGGAFARGVAYSTRDPAHLLNVRTSRMGAFEDRPQDFYHWLLAHEAQWRTRHPALAELPIAPEGFMPRLLYGDYIAALLEEASRNGSGVTIEKIPMEVTDAEISAEGVTLIRADGGRQKATRLVLALGNLPTAGFGLEKALSRTVRYVGSLWAPAKGSILTRNRFTGEDEPVLIIGTGLTMVDMLLSLRGRGYHGKVVAVSRHGLLPQPHNAGSVPYSRFLVPQSAPRTALGLVSAIRREVASAAGKGQNWRDVIDSLRADTPLLWAGLPERERRKLARLLAFWNTHRHRMPLSSAQVIAREISAGTFEVRSGHIEDIAEAGKQLLVRIRSKDGQHETIAAAHVLNCAGPGMNIDTSGSPLLLRLRARALIERGPLGWGLAAEDNGRVKGNAPGRIFALGPVLTGERLETVAVPELRQQAEVTAASVLSSLA